jgi:hypothetical protein
MFAFPMEYIDREADGVQQNVVVFEILVELAIIIIYYDFGQIRRHGKLFEAYPTRPE